MNLGCPIHHGTIVMSAIRMMLTYPQFGVPLVSSAAAEDQGFELKAEV
jgi:hypothetical protein